MLRRRAVTRSSILTKDQGGGEAAGCRLVLDLKGGCNVAASLPGSLGRSVLLRRPGRCLRGGGAGVPLAPHEGEDAEKNPNSGDRDRHPLRMSNTGDSRYLFLVSWGTTALASMFL